MAGIELERITDYTYGIRQTTDVRMKVPGLVFSSPALVKYLKNDQSLQQVVNVSMLPGIVGASMAMPDIHWGYGFPIGGVAAFDAEDGVISPGGVGYDINCGVSLIRTDLHYDQLKPKLRQITDNLFKNVPSGMGSTSSKVRQSDIDDILKNGLSWCTENNMATKSDVMNTEENGSMKYAMSDAISAEAKKRGLKQIGTLGAGNHFLEIQIVDRIYDEEVAGYFGIKRTGQVTIMIHTGSRGLGHQVATDFIRNMNSGEHDVVMHPVDRQLVSAKINSKLGEKYTGAMNAAANFGFVNRQVIVHNVRKTFSADFPDSEIELMYSLAHNIAKREKHRVDGEYRDLVVHRKGATRAFSSVDMTGDAAYSKYGHPVLIPGDMGTASYILVGKEGNDSISFGSSCHGAGRKLSRKKSMETFNSSEVIAGLAHKGIYLRAQNRQVVSEEAPGSYKDIDEVIDAVTGAGLTMPIARLVPVGVVKG